MPFSDVELDGLSVASRVSSTISLLGILFTLITFTIFPQFNKPITRLVYYATWTNLVGVIAPLIGRAGIDAGDDSALCQFQGFIVNLSVIESPTQLCELKLIISAVAITWTFTGRYVSPSMYTSCSSIAIPPTC
jgi:hypothetical protein